MVTETKIKFRNRLRGFIRSKGIGDPDKWLAEKLDRTVPTIYAMYTDIETSKQKTSRRLMVDALPVKVGELLASKEPNPVHGMLEDAGWEG